jgi:predicted DNA binding CopG/RHH family protein
MATVCTKTSYSSERFALEHIAIIEKKSQRFESPKSAYLCKKCNTWHITKQESIENIKSQLSETKELLKSREEELFKTRIALKNFENIRNASSGTNEFQIKVRVLEKELIAVKANSAKNGNKYNEISVKMNTVKNIVNKAIKNKWSLEELIKKIQEKL